MQIEQVTLFWLAEAAAFAALLQRAWQKEPLTSLIAAAPRAARNATAMARTEGFAMVI